VVDKLDLITSGLTVSTTSLSRVSLQNSDAYGLSKSFLYGGGFLLNRPSSVVLVRHVPDAASEVTIDISNEDVIFLATTLFSPFSAFEFLYFQHHGCA